MFWFGSLLWWFFDIFFWGAVLVFWVFFGFDGFFWGVGFWFVWLVLHWGGRVEVLVLIWWFFLSSAAKVVFLWVEERKRKKNKFPKLLFRVHCMLILPMISGYLPSNSKTKPKWNIR